MGKQKKKKTELKEMGTVGVKTEIIMEGGQKKRKIEIKKRSRKNNTQTERETTGRT